LLAYHRQIIDCVILDHVEGIFFEAQPITLPDDIQSFKRVDFDNFALSSKDVFDDSYFLQIFISLKGWFNKHIDDLQFNLMVFYLI